MDQIEQLLTRGVDGIYPSKEHLEKVLKSGKKITLYQGFDPTGTDLHIGHMIGLRKLKQWQELGHTVIFLVGDGTGQAGDPSGKLSSREKFFTNEELRENAKAYVMQASKIVNFDGDNPIQIKYNGDWLNKLKLVDILEIAGHFTLQQLSERDMFQERMKNNMPINMREFLYPLLQGYDSVAMKVDLELGGSDQLFNMLCGRTLVKAYLQKEKFVMTTPLLADSQGRKIGKSEGNVIGLTDKPADLYRKIMNLSDDIIVSGLEYLTDVPMDQIQDIEKKLKSGSDPREYKNILATEIVTQLHSKEDAQKAAQTANLSVHLSDEIKVLDLPITTISGSTISHAIVETGNAQSNSESKRLVEQGGVELIILDSEKLEPLSIKDPFYRLPAGENLIRIGKKKLIKIKK